ncbi:MAG: MBL fold metallo-hydrolase [Verrucomicrobiota bacterium]
MNTGAPPIEIYTGGVAATNAFWWEAPEGTVLVDAPEGVVDWLVAAGRGVSVLLLTHQHFDHVWDARKVADQWDCPILAHSAYGKHLTLETLLASIPGLDVSVSPYEVSTVLAGEEQLEMAGCSFGLAHIPGHSPDSLVYHDASAGHIFGGDTLFAGGIGRTDFPGGSLPLLQHGIREKMLPMGDEATLFPGHGETTLLGEERRTNPFLR